MYQDSGHKISSQSIPYISEMPLIFFFFGIITEYSINPLCNFIFWVNLCYCKSFVNVKQKHYFSQRRFYKSSLNHIYLLKFYILHESKLFFKAFFFSCQNITYHLYEWILIFKGIQNAIYMSLCVCVCDK